MQAPLFSPNYFRNRLPLLKVWRSIRLIIQMRIHRMVASVPRRLPSPVISGSSHLYLKMRREIRRWYSPVLLSSSNVEWSWAWTNRERRLWREDNHHLAMPLTKNVINFVPFQFLFRFLWFVWLGRFPFSGDHRGCRFDDMQYFDWVGWCSLGSDVYFAKQRCWGSRV